MFVAHEEFHVAGVLEIGEGGEEGGGFYAVFLFVRGEVGEGDVEEGAAEAIAYGVTVGFASDGFDLV